MVCTGGVASPLPDSTQSNKQRRRQLAAFILLLVAIGSASVVYLLAGMVKPSLSHSPSGPLTPTRSGELAKHVGSAVCMSCHAAEYQAWA